MAGELYTERSAQILNLGAHVLRPTVLIDAEITWQVQRLEGLAEVLSRDQRVLALGDGCDAVVPDTNVFMHYEFYDDVNWPKLTGSKRIRLVIPQIVIDELDDLSFRSKGDSRRARQVIKSLRELRAGKPAEESVLVPKNRRKDVELQILLDPPGHRRRPNNDDEIMARAEYLAAFVGQQRLWVMAGDYGMQLRSSVYGLRCLGADMLKPRSQDVD